jgi:hypothetical protein
VAQFTAAGLAAGQVDRGSAMAAIETLVLVAGAIGFAFVAIATTVVIIGIHQEERRMTAAHGGPPTGLAMLARRMLGAHFCLLAPESRANPLFQGVLAVDERQLQALTGQGHAGD